jgi:hypothetical protein
MDSFWFLVSEVPNMYVSDILNSLLLYCDMATESPEKGARRKGYSSASMLTSSLADYHLRTNSSLTAINSFRVRESELLYDWQLTANQFVLAASALRLTTINFIFQLNTCGYSPYMSPSLMRG